MPEPVWFCDEYKLIHSGLQNFRNKIYHIGSFIYYVGKVFRKTNIFLPLVWTPKCAHLGIRNVSFSDNFACVLNQRFAVR